MTERTESVAEHELIALLLTEDGRDMGDDDVFEADEAETVTGMAGQTSRGVQTEFAGKAEGPDPGSRMMTGLFGVIVVSICMLIGFHVWLSLKMSGHGVAFVYNVTGEGPPIYPAYSLDDMYNASMQPRVYETHWYGDKSCYYHNEDDGRVVAHDVNSGNVTQLFNASFLDGNSFTLTSDLRFALIVSSQARSKHYQLFDRAIDTYLPFPRHSNFTSGRLLFARFFKRGNSIVFGHGCNIYYQTSPLHTAIQLTASGRRLKVYNGITDWTYQHLLGRDDAVFESPDARYLAYLQLNTTTVPRFRYLEYDHFATTVRSFPFSPAGGNAENRAQTRVTLRIVDLNREKSHAAEEKHVTIPAPADMRNRDHYIVRVEWRNAYSLAVMWVNRAQNQSTLMLCTVTGHCVENHKEMIVGGWIEPWPPVYFIHDGEEYLTILPKPEGETGDWLHLALMTSTMTSPGTVRFLTHGQMEVTSVEAYDPDTNYVYYITTNGDPKQRYLFRLSLNTTPSDPECLSCDLDPPCTYVSVRFSGDAKRYNLHCQGPGVPYNVLRTTDGTRATVLEDNALLSWGLGRRDVPRVRFLQVPVGGGHAAWVRVTVPQQSDRDQDRKWYPVLFDVRGSSGADERFRVGVGAVLAGRGIVHVELDVRGAAAGARGQRYRHSGYRHLTNADVDDHLLAARWMSTPLHVTDRLLTHLHIADRKRFAIWGTGYGGLVAMHALANESDTFRCAMAAGAPADLRFTGAVETERYMGYATGEDNLAGYRRSNILEKLHLLESKNLLVVHGTGDTNISFASAASLLSALNEAGVKHRQYVYPGEVKYQDRHFVELMMNFLTEECFLTDNTH